MSNEARKLWAFKASRCGNIGDLNRWFAPRLIISTTIQPIQFVAACWLLCWTLLLILSWAGFVESCMTCLELSIYLLSLFNVYSVYHKVITLKCVCFHLFHLLWKFFHKKSSNITAFCNMHLCLIVELDSFYGEVSKKLIHVLWYSKDPETQNRTKLLAFLTTKVNHL